MMCWLILLNSKYQPCLSVLIATGKQVKMLQKSEEKYTVRGKYCNFQQFHSGNCMNYQRPQHSTFTDHLSTYHLLHLFLSL